MPSTFLRVFQSTIIAAANVRILPTAAESALLNGANTALNVSPRSLAMSPILAKTPLLFSWTRSTLSPKRFIPASASFILRSPKSASVSSSADTPVTLNRSLKPSQIFLRTFPISSRAFLTPLLTESTTSPKFLNEKFVSLKLDPIDEANCLIRSHKPVKVC